MFLICWVCLNGYCNATIYICAIGTTNCVEVPGTNGFDCTNKTPDIQAYSGYETCRSPGVRCGSGKLVSNSGWTSFDINDTSLQNFKKVCKIKKKMEKSI